MTIIYYIFNLEIDGLIFSEPHNYLRKILIYNFSNHIFVYLIYLSAPGLLFKNVLHYNISKVLNWEITMHKGKWNFPLNNFGRVIGINDAGIETFKGDRYSSLAREICQNSMDARFDSKKPCEVEFYLEQIGTDQIPDVDNLKNAIYACTQYWKGQEPYIFFKNALDDISSKSISILRVSDFNTKGLEGSNVTTTKSIASTTPWESLVMSSGISSKESTAGGSFGIGKSAPFACSSLRTVFYSTMDIHNVLATQGVANLVSFNMNIVSGKNKSNNITQGVGYYSSDEKNSPIKEMINITNFKRKKPGTDIYILGFIKKENWIDEIVKSITDNYLIAIYRYELIVRVQDKVVSSETLPSIMEKYKDSIKSTYDYYRVLTSKDTEDFKDDFENLGGIHFKLLNGGDRKTNRSVLMSRSNGMKVFDQKRISPNPFSGICLLEGEKINAYFRKMETPQHNKWEAERHPNPVEAEENRIKLYRYLKEIVENFQRKNVTDEIDAIGADKYIPDFTSSEETENEIDNEKPLTFDLKKQEISFSKEITPADDSSEEFFAGREDEFSDEIGYKRGEQSSGQIREDPLNPGFYIVKNGDEVIRKRKILLPGKIRFFMSNYSENIYTLSFTPKRDATNAEVSFRISGENVSSKISIKMAKKIANNHTLNIKSNKILLGDLKGNQKYTIYLKFNTNEKYKFEVSPYGEEK